MIEVFASIPCHRFVGDIASHNRVQHLVKIAQHFNDKMDGIHAAFRVFLLVFFLGRNKLVLIDQFQRIDQIELERIGLADKKELTEEAIP